MGEFFMKWKQWVVAMTAALALATVGCGAATTNNQSASQTTGASGPSNSSGNTQPAPATAPASNTSAPAPGHMAPSFSLPMLNGTQTVSLQDLLNKKEPILLNAWASWCPPCQMETPDLVKMSKQYQGKVQFIGIDMTTQENHLSDAVAFVKKYKIPYTVLKDPQGQFMNAYALQGFPTTFFVSPSGKIINVQFGMMTSTQMKQMIDQAIAQSK